MLKGQLSLEFIFCILIVLIVLFLFVRVNVYYKQTLEKNDFQETNEIVCALKKEFIKINNGVLKNDKCQESTNNAK